MTGLVAEHDVEPDPDGVEETAAEDGTEGDADPDEPATESEEDLPRTALMTIAAATINARTPNKGRIGPDRDRA